MGVCACATPMRVCMCQTAHKQLLLLQLASMDGVHACVSQPHHVAQTAVCAPCVCNLCVATEQPHCVRMSLCAATPTGFVSARLRGEYEATRDDRIDLEFKNITLNIGPFKAAEKVCPLNTDAPRWQPVCSAVCQADSGGRPSWRFSHVVDGARPSNRLFFGSMTQP